MYLEDYSGNYPSAWDGKRDWTHPKVLGKYVAQGQVESTLYCPSQYDRDWSGGYGMNYRLLDDGKKWAQEKPAEVIGIVDYLRATVWRSWQSAIPFRHSDGVNGLFLDGHVGWKLVVDLEDADFGF